LANHSNNSADTQPHSSGPHGSQQPLRQLGWQPVWGWVGASQVNESLVSGWVRTWPVADGVAWVGGVGAVGSVGAVGGVGAAAGWANAQLPQTNTTNTVVTTRVMGGLLTNGE
jgi:hypothetical protein